MLSQCILILLIILLAYFAFKDTKVGDMVEKRGNQLLSYVMPNAQKKADSEKSYDEVADDKLGENQEYFAVCKDQGDVNKVLDCVCGDSEPSFAKWDYGNPNMSWSDYAASQAIDDKTVVNHLTFVRDRRGLGPEGEFITGRTWSPDSHDSYDPIPWVGIRGRPEYVQQCNPTQVPDIDTNLYKGHRPYCFRT